MAGSAVGINIRCVYNRSKARINLVYIQSVHNSQSGQLAVSVLPERYLNIH